MKPLGSLLGLLLGLLGGTGCCHFAAKPKAALPPPPLPAVTVAEFARPKDTRAAFSETVLETNAQFTVRRVELPVLPSGGAPERSVVFDCYVPVRKGLAPVILVLPVSGGDYELERHFARYFARHGLAALIMHREKKRSGPVRLEDFDPSLRQSVFDHKRVLDWVEVQPELDERRIGVFGVSIGGIKGALLVALDPRVRAAVLGLAGSDLPFILTHTTEGSIKRQRAAVLRERQWSPEQLQRELRQAIMCDPLYYAAYADPRKVLLVLGTCDTVVPFKQGWELRTKMDRPETILVPAGHYSALVFIPYIRHETVGFFRKKLEIGAAAKPASGK